MIIKVLLLQYICRKNTKPKTRQREGKEVWGRLAVMRSKQERLKLYMH